MSVILDFTFVTKGLEVMFENHSSGVPTDYILEWDFGDGSSTSSEENPGHIYTSVGIYTVILKYRKNSQIVDSLKQKLVVTDKVESTLPGSIYELIDTYVSPEIFGTMPYYKRQQFIRKWQLFIGPLVEHEIPTSEYTNELYYEALENQLIMELSAYDWLTIKVSEMIQANNQALIENSTSSESSSEAGSGEIKVIKTGPTEVEYFDGEKTDVDTASMISKAIGPGGIIDLLKEKICMLSERLSIYLPICRTTRNTRIVPRVVNRRDTSGLNGPDPRGLVKK